MAKYLGVVAVVSATALPDEIIGYYSWNWGAGSTGSAGANMGCAFTGLVDVDQAIAQYVEGASWCCPALEGQKILTVGGGNSAGLFSASTLAAVTAKAAAIKAAGYDGIMYDVEEVQGPSSSLVPLFKQSFAAMKGAGLIVGVTTSHSAPYQCDTAQDAVDFVNAWVADPNIDILSPQLYSSGQEGSPEFAETASCKAQGCTWDLYKSSHAAIAPSIVLSSQYTAVQSWCKQTFEVECRGYFEWAQKHSVYV